MPAQDTQIPLQSDTLSTVPGGGVRTATVTVNIAGVPTQVQMQVVSLATPDGTVVDQFIALQTNVDILNVLRDIKSILLKTSGGMELAVLENQNDNPPAAVDQP